VKSLEMENRALKLENKEFRWELSAGSLPHELVSFSQLFAASCREVP
jgi:hypothetical protein